MITTSCMDFMHKIGQELRKYLAYHVIIDILCIELEPLREELNFCFFYCNGS